MNKYARMLISDGRQGVKGTGRYGIGGSRYYGRRDRASEDMADRRYYDDMRGRRDYADDYRGRDYGDRPEYDDRMEHDMRYRRDYGYHEYDDDMARGRRDYAERDIRDYGEPKLFSKKDIEEWKKLMHNEDGSRGEHFRPEQVRHASQQVGIDSEEFGEDVFALAMNMLYSDYCKVAKKYGFDRPEVYADLAKAFLRDKDFEGKPEEKLYIYYKGIVAKDE